MRLDFLEPFGHIWRAAARNIDLIAALLGGGPNRRLTEPVRVKGRDSHAYYSPTK
jgi:hypothetical protein